MAYLLYQYTQVLFALASTVFALRLVAIQRRQMPILMAWASWTAVGSIAAFAVNQYSLHLYSVLWPYQEGLDLAMLTAATLEIFYRTCHGVRGLGDIRRGLFWFAAGAGVIAGTAAIVLDGQITNASASPILLSSHAIGVALAIFTATFLGFFKITGQEQAPNLSTHARTMAVYLAIWATCRIFLNYEATAHGAILGSLLSFSLVYCYWALRLRKKGDIKNIKNKPRGTPQDLQDFASGLTGLAREIRERQRVA